METLQIVQENIRDKISKARGDSDGKLEPLTEKWIGVCQEALQELQRKTEKEQISIGKLIMHFNIDAKLIRYNEEDDSFY